MEDKIDRLLDEIKEIKENLKPDGDSWFERTVHVLEKLVVPVLIGLLAWFGSLAATKISEGQLHLAESAAEDRKSEFRRSMQAKFIDIFYKDLNSGDQKSQLNAIRLVRLVDGELAQGLLDLVAVTPGISQAVITKAGEAKRELEALRPLGGYKIGIYYYRDDASSMPSVVKIQERLRQVGFTGTVQLYPRDNAFFQEVVPPAGIEIRYEQGIEDEAADALHNILQTPSPIGQVVKWQVGNRTPNFISVFVPKGG